MIALYAIVYTVGFLWNMPNSALSKREGASSMHVWQDAFNFGVDLSFVLPFPLWFFELDVPLFKVLWVFNAVYVCSELFNLKGYVKHERRQLYGAYYGAEVTERQGWARTIEFYALGFLAAVVARFLLGDSMCLLLFLLTIPNCFVPAFWILLKRQERRGISWCMIAAGWGNILVSFLPGGLYTTLIPSLESNPGFWILGIITVYSFARTTYLYYKLPPKPAEINGVEAGRLYG